MVRSVDAEVVERSGPSSCSVKLAVDKQMGHIGSLVNDGVGSLVVKVGKGGDDLFEFSVVVCVIAEVVFYLVVHDIVAQCLHLFGVTLAECGGGIVEQGGEVCISLVVEFCFLIVGQEGSEERFHGCIVSCFS